MKISDKTLKRIIKETIDDVIEFGKPEPRVVPPNMGKDCKFTPYTQKERERNFRNIGQMRNPHYDRFHAWQEGELAKGRPMRELGWESYKREVGNNNDWF